MSYISPAAWDSLFDRGLARSHRDVTGEGFTTITSLGTAALDGYIRSNQ